MISDNRLLLADDRAEFFHGQVEPLLQKHCYRCHSHSAGQMENGLALDWKSGWATGGERGPAVVPGHPEESLLLRAIKHLDTELKMPEEKLGEAEIIIFEEWIRQGAFDDRVNTPALQKSEVWWSLKPLTAPLIPQSRGGVQADHPIDSFIVEKLTQAGLTQSPEASPRDLMRRVHFDLVGLPPASEVVASFEADPSQSAYERIVDELLASPHYGERWARHWLDTIHFADSHGYEHDVGRSHAWPYRDYVIQAFNNDLDWSTFIRQQLAVDYFEPESRQLIPALGFLGAGTFDYSTYATGPVTFDYIDRDDMLTQTMAAFVSTTANCARCHDHKFDPITQEDYYALQAVFAGIVKGDIQFDPDSQVGGSRHRLDQLLEAVKRGDKNELMSESSQRLVSQWLFERGPGADWKPLNMQSFVSTEGATLVRQSNGQILASGPAPDKDTYVVTATIPLTRMTALRLDVLSNDSLPMKGPGRCENGNLHLSEVVITAFKAGDSSGTPVPISRATADFNQEGWTIDHAIDGHIETAWGIHPLEGLSHHAVFEFAQPLDLPSGTFVTIALKQAHGRTHLIGEFRLSATDRPVTQSIALPSDVEEALRISSSQRTETQVLIIAQHVLRLAIESELSRLPQPAVVYAAASSAAIPLGDEKSLAASIPVPKVVHFMQRGDLNKPQQVVPPGALSALTHLPSRFQEAALHKEPARRAALADWIAHHENVLTWRSVVNRVWQYHFGRGLCDTPSDLGRMGGIPSHPELIDWMAVWFRDDANGSLKRLHRLIVTSRTYRQAVEPSPESTLIDSENRLLWRQNRLRLDADAFRDYVLMAAGRIDFTMGGPPIKHFQQSPGIQLTPVLDYAAYDWGNAGSSRRSIYRCVWRGIPDPMMSALDFPDLGLLAPTRTNSISPLQALALYNNNFVLFHSQMLARKISENTTDVDQQINDALWRTIQRAPSSLELEQYRDFVQRHGLAALCRVLLNTNEFLFVP